MSSGQNKSCLAFFDLSGVYRPQVFCPVGQNCCGPCNSRKCCSDSNLEIFNQSFCVTGEPVSSSPVNRYYMNVSLESVIEICFLTVGLLVVTSFIYFKVRERIMKHNTLIAPVELMNSSSTSSVLNSYSSSSPPPYNTAANGQQTNISTISHPNPPPPSYSDLVKDPNLFPNANLSTQKKD